MHRSVATEAEIAKAAAELARLVESQAVLVTRSEEGMTLHIEGHAPIHIPAYPVKVRDVSGAGDTVAAVMAVLLAMQAPFEIRHARRERSRCRGRRQARHGDGLAGRAPPSHPARRFARA